MNIPGTCGKESDNLIEQNYANIVAFAGENLFKELAFDIKPLLGWHQIL